MDSTLLRPLPYRDPASLTVLWEDNPKIEGFLAQRVPVAGRNFFEWRNRLHAFEQIEALRRSTESLTGMGRPENLIVARVTPGFFRLLGRGAWLGRTFQTADTTGNCAVAVVGAAFFARTFPGGASTFDAGVDRKLILNGAPYKIVGVMPADFHLPARMAGPRGDPAGRMAAGAARSRASHRGRIAPQLRLRAIARRRLHRAGAHRTCGSHPPARKGISAS